MQTSPGMQEIPITEEGNIRRIGAAIQTGTFFPKKRGMTRFAVIISKGGFRNPALFFCSQISISTREKDMAFVFSAYQAKNHLSNTISLLACQGK